MEQKWKIDMIGQNWKDGEFELDKIERNWTKLNEIGQNWTKLDKIERN